jgi:hypothetical protein
MIMSTARKQSGVSNIEIPPELNAKLDHFFSTLKRKALQGGVRQAARRAATDHCAVLQVQDLIESARAALMDGTAELPSALLSHESLPVRRAS